MTAQTTIEKLRRANAEKDEAIRKMSVLNKALRKSSPELAALYDERESLRKMVEIYEAEMEALTKTVGGALLKAMESPANGGAGFTLGDAGLTLKSGAGTWAPQLSAKKAREEDEAKEVRRAAHRIVTDGNVEILRAREARKRREEGRPI